MNKRNNFTILFFLVIFFIFILKNISFANSENNIKTYSEACILVEPSTQKILYEKNANEIKYPASTTKIMTAILALENCELSDIATVSHNAIFSVPISYSHASLKEGEKFTIEQLLYALLIPSANDAANVIAEHISGSVEEFAKLMNEKAKEIGCKNTHFVNANGIHNKEHVTTAYDLSLIGSYAMKNNTFRKIVKSTRYTLPKTEKYNKDDRIFNTTNELLRENYSNSKSNYYYKYANGAKTGYTDEAGSCIVASAKKDEMEVIVVILGGHITNDGLSQRFLDCKKLFDYAFENYELKTLNKKNSILKQIEISGATKETKNLDVLVKDDIEVLIQKKKAKDKIQPNIKMKDLKAPITAGDKIGTITYNIEGTEYTSELVAKNNVISSNVMSIAFRFLLIILTVYLLYILLTSESKKRKIKTSKNTKKTTKGKCLFKQINNFK